METPSVLLASSRSYYWATVYVAIIVVVNVLFGMSDTWRITANVLVGVAFVVRDLAQRDLGDRVLYATGAGLAVSFVMASPAVVWPSTIAFALSETLDWAVVRRLRHRPMWQRMMASHALSIPIDTGLFLVGLALTGVAPWAWVGFWRMNACKAAALVVVALRRP